MVNDHRLICNSPIDINIAKQVNIMVNELGLGLDRIVMDPTTGALGYGIEYVYSIIERMTLGSLAEDTMLAMPILNFVGWESWQKAKEVREPESDYPEWGPQRERGVLWEILTATTLLQAGSDCVVLYHPESIQRVQNNIDRLMDGEM
jgi:acetyl-CoA decarbonylase/synthase complex subunit delta